MTVRRRLTEWIRCIFGSPNYDRLVSEIAQTDFELKQEIESGAGDAKVLASAKTLLDEAKKSLKTNDLQTGWVLITATQREVLRASNIEAFRRRKIELRHETESKIGGWRKKAIKDFLDAADTALTGSTGGGSKENDAKDYIINALAIRDNCFHNDYFKLTLRKWHLFNLSVVIWTALLIILILSFIQKIPQPFQNGWLTAAVILFGLLGACVSIAQGIMASGLTDKIPAQQLGAFVFSVRPGIGAAAALVSLALLNSGYLTFPNKDAPSQVIFLLVAFAAGYSERFIMGAVGRMSDAAGAGNTN
jgi:hypothetical protein